MEADLHNLVPAVGEINGVRSDYRFFPSGEHSNMYGQCDFKVDFNLRKADPAQTVKGEIPLIYLYYSFQMTPFISRVDFATPLI